MSEAENVPAGDVVIVEVVSREDTLNELFVTVSPADLD
jgi:hypothetical protein